MTSSGRPPPTTDASNQRTGDQVRLSSRCRMSLLHIPPAVRAGFPTQRQPMLRLSFSPAHAIVRFRLAAWAAVVAVAAAIPAAAATPTPRSLPPTAPGLATPGCLRSHRSEPGRVFSRGTHPQVNVASGSRQAMTGDRVGSNDEKFNAICGQRVQHLCEVAIHRMASRRMPRPRR